VKDIQETQGTAVNYPMIGDADLNVAKLYDMIHPNASGGKRTAADNATIRSVFIIGPDKKVKAMLIYPMSAAEISTRFCACSIHCSSMPNTRWRRR